MNETSSCYIQTQSYYAHSAQDKLGNLLPRKQSRRARRLSRFKRLTTQF